MNALEIRGLTKVYKAKKGKKVQALSSLDLAIDSGEVFGFLGPNGAGKSTTIKTIMGLITATAGGAQVFGVPITDPRARLKIGFLPENPSFYDFLTAREYLAFVGRAFSMDAQSIAAGSDRVLRLMELQGAADRPIRGYSKGMVQRLGLAQALLHDPPLYILDEPMSGLDPLGRALVKDIIKELKARGKTVFFSTHITADVEVVCDRVGVIVGGRLRAVDRVENLLQSGIEGYSVQLRDLPAGSGSGAFGDFAMSQASGGVINVDVPQDRFTEFVALVSRAGAEICLVEPKRKDLEAFFLEIVAKGKE